MEKVISKHFKSQYLKRFALMLTLILGYTAAFCQTATSTETASPSSGVDYTLAYVLLIVMVLLFVIIWFLGKILESSSDYFVDKWKKEQKEESGSAAKITVLAFFLLSTVSSFAANTVMLQATADTGLISGLPAILFYIIISLLFVEFIVVIVLAWQVWNLVSSKVLSTQEAEGTSVANDMKLSWWDKFNKFKPLSSEADLDLGHDYDGIRELDNKLPPWWLYGFYLTIAVAVIYLYRYSFAHTGLSSKQEYEASVQAAELAKNDFLKKSGNAIDENTVTLLKDESSLASGMATFKTICSVCHGQKGEGLVGPNLTDDYWIYGGGIKDLFKTIKYGTNKGMQSWKEMLPPEKIAQVASYIKTLRGSNPPNAKPPVGTLYVEEVIAAPAKDSTTAKK